ncbi:MAG TPA: nitroreductase family protein, partial [Sedimentisphaerales bacterium]|nr:nitroreductase family protein [Sedimentisphaerales bacterium]
MGEIIKLTEPNQAGSMPLERAIAVRRSQRHFLPKSLTLEQIGQLAWAAQGQEPASRYRTTPSAGATYPLELFVVTEEGMFLYLPAKHSLEKLAGQDMRTALAS